MAKGAFPSAAELNAVAGLRTALRRFDAATDRVTKRHALTPRWYDLLAILHGTQSRSCTARELAGILDLGRSSVTEFVSRAQVAGLVERAADPRDDRVKHIRPTPEGTRRYLAAMTELRSERKQLLELLETMTREAATLTDLARSARPPRRRAPRRAPPRG